MQSHDIQLLQAVKDYLGQDVRFQKVLQQAKVCQTAHQQNYASIVLILSMLLGFWSDTKLSHTDCRIKL